MNQFDFQKTMDRYLSGRHTAEEEAFIMEYLSENPMNEAPVFENEKELIGKRIKKKLFAAVFRKPVYLRLALWLSVAATIVLVAGCWLLWDRNLHDEMSVMHENTAVSGLVEIRNTSGKVQHIPLRDGSTVLLKKNSSLSLAGNFGDHERKVYLRGEAFFKVKTNAAKPFIVSTGNLETKVLGTSFNISSYENSPSVEVRVKTGRVSVYEGSESKSLNRNGVILTPNQKITFDKKTRKMDLAIVENPSMVIPAHETLHGFLFADIPVTNVFSALEKSYGIDIVLENATADSCLFTGDLNGLTLFQQLDLICKSTNTTYERRGTALFVQGAGCSN